MLAVRRLRGVIERLFAELEQTASRDALTGALNRGAFERLLELHRAGPAARWLLLLDIDHFTAS